MGLEELDAVERVFRTSRCSAGTVQELGHGQPAPRDLIPLPSVPSDWTERLMRFALTSVFVSFACLRILRPTFFWRMVDGGSLAVHALRPLPILPVSWR